MAPEPAPGPRRAGQTALLLSLTRRTDAKAGGPSGTAGEAAQAVVSGHTGKAPCRGLGSNGTRVENGKRSARRPRFHLPTGPRDRRFCPARSGGAALSQKRSCGSCMTASALLTLARPRAPRPPLSHSPEVSEGGLGCLPKPSSPAPLEKAAASLTAQPGQPKAAGSSLATRCLPAERSPCISSPLCPRAAGWARGSWGSPGLTKLAFK